MIPQAQRETPHQVRERRIHPTAIVHPAAELHESVEVGPYAVIGPLVTIGAHTTIGPHAVIEGDTTIGEGNRIFQFASIGAIPQVLKYAGEPTRLVIGDRNTIREFATIHIGTVDGGSVTRIGDGNLLMAYSHVAHDCIVGNGCIFANNVTLGGHVVVDDFASIGGLAGVHQRTRIGTHAFVSASALVVMDITPYCFAQGDRAAVVGINSAGLLRHGFEPAPMARIKSSYRTLFRSGLLLADALTKLRTDYAAHDEIQAIVRFAESSERGLARERSRRRGAA